MSIINIGSINIDHVYHVERFVAPGETFACKSYSRGLGGKGLNQSIALLRAGAQVFHVGAVGKDDHWVRTQIAAAGVDASCIMDSDAATGHAIIQVNMAGENCILLYPGANHTLATAMLQTVFEDHPANECDWVLLQNEINLCEEAIVVALAAGRKVAMNPAPCTPDLAKLPLEKLSLLIVNEIEAQQLSGATTPDQALAALGQRCPNTLVVMTLGADGIRATQGGQIWVQPALPTKVLDTTAAGDTVTGYLLAALEEGQNVAAALHLAARAAAITVSRAGAASSIPLRNELFAAQ